MKGVPIIDEVGCFFNPLAAEHQLAASAPHAHVAIGNPKAILIFTAFLPQFVSVGSTTPVSEQFLWLGLLFLLLEWAAIALYAGLGAYMQRWFSQPGPRRLFNRVSASLLGCAGLGLLAARR